LERFLSAERGFVPAAELVAWGVPKGATFCCGGKGPRREETKPRVSLPVRTNFLERKMAKRKAAQSGRLENIKYLSRLT
jgi:hypothetical protein